MTSLKETILKEFDNLHSKCIATDAQYTDKELVEILSNVIKRNYEEDRLFIIKKLQSIEERVMSEIDNMRIGRTLVLGTHNNPSKINNTVSRHVTRGYDKALRDIRTALSKIFKGRS